MKTESAVQVQTSSRIHMGLVVKNLEQSVAFYRTLFGQEPTKTRPHYAKFEVAEPAPWSRGEGCIPCLAEESCSSLVKPSTGA